MPKVRPQLAHLGIFATDLVRMEDFYTKVFNLIVTDRGIGAVFKSNLIFMSSAPDQHHQFVLASGRDAATPSMIMQLSFMVDSLDELRQVRDTALANGAEKMMELNHGNAWSIYFQDPEDNRIEVYLDTPFHTPQPCGHKLDLSLSDADILAATQKLTDELPGSMAMQEYVDYMADVLTRQ